MNVMFDGFTRGVDLRLERDQEVGNKGADQGLRTKFSTRMPSI